MAPFHLARRQTFTPLLTPFSDNRIDIEIFKAAIDRQIIAGVDGIVIGDPIGEGPTLTQGERDILLATSIGQARPHLTVIAAAGTNCTAGTIGQCRRAEQLGADALLVTVPYYSKPMLRGVIDHFRQIAVVVGIPLIVDDDPGRTARDYGPALLEGLAELDIVVGICHGADRLSHFATLPAPLKDRFVHLSRDEKTFLQFLDAGGHGAVSPLANVIPSPVQTMITMMGGVRNSNSLANAIEAVSVALGPDNVAALKDAQCFLHPYSPDVRLPLVAAEPETVIRVRRALAPFTRYKPGMKSAA